MKLLSVEIQRYRRFFEKSRINLDGDVVAIVGPNEAGKSSFLSALTHFNDDRPITREEISRGEDPAEDEVLLKARFLLDERDFKTLSNLPGASSLRWFTIGKTRDGTLHFDVEPRLSRDLQPRERVRASLEQLGGSPWLRNIDFDHPDREIAMKVASVSQALGTDADTLAREALGELQEFTVELEGLIEATSPPKYVQRIPQALRGLLALEREKTPQHVATDRLWKNSPLFLIFGDEERSLESTYDLVTVAEDPPKALANLASLADLDLTQLLELIHVEDYAEARTLLTKANATLDRIFSESWRQSKLSINFEHDGTVVRIFARAIGGTYTRIAERSDGVRAFMALIAFTSLESENHPPILLVDEAERHLHYDAQADLVRVFTKQDAASQVIYTTHSAGCLPQDLGTGVRVLVVEEEEGRVPRSRALDQFWLEGPGLSPLLIAMGASTLAFTPTRYAVIAEGPTELVLLPTLFREATGLTDVGFQVAPGTASASPETLKRHNLEAVHVAYVVDGDEGGRAIRQKLIRSGIDSSHVVSLGNRWSGLAVEDFVKKSVYLGAVNEELRRSHGPVTRVPMTALTSKNRSRAITDWCEKNGLAPPRKVAVAYGILAQRRTRPLLDSRRAATLRRTYRDLADALKLDVQTGT